MTEREALPSHNELPVLCTYLPNSTVIVRAAASYSLLQPRPKYNDGSNEPAVSRVGLEPLEE
jgi:hypothetical protein